MEKVTKKNMIKYIDLKKDYEKTGNKKTLKKINTFTNEIINKDKKYYSKISKYGFNNDQLKYCL